jgi:RHS repeat-associated protein
MPSPTQILLCQYRYDPLDRLIGHSLADFSLCHRFYRDSRLITEIQGTIGISIIQHDDWLLAQQQRQSHALDTTLLTTDLKRSIMHTLKANNQPQLHVYSPYGHCPAGNGLLSLLGFNGERPDPVTGHYLLGNGYRAFNPVLMCFNSPDSLSPFGKGGFNTYAYGQCDPINLYDPTGHVPITSLLKDVSKLVLGRRNLITVDDWIDNVYLKTPKHMRPQFERKTPDVGKQIKRTKSLPNIQAKSVEGAEYNDLIGFHGSHPRNTKSLLSGIDPARGRIEYYGKGFYSTPIYERTVHYGAKRFGVYVKNQKTLKEGRDYSFHKSPDSPQHGDFVEVVIRPPAFESVRIREVTKRSSVILPRPHEAPY